MANCRNTNKNSQCGETNLNKGTGVVYDPFSVCLPFGRVLEYDGAGLRLTGETSVVDGVYNTVTIVDGCLTDVGQDELPPLTHGPCAPYPLGCDDEPGGGSGTIIREPGDCNLLNQNASNQWYAKVNFAPSDNVEVLGCGSSNSPFRINITAGEARTYITTTTPEYITVNGTGAQTNPYLIAHVEYEGVAGTYNGLTFNGAGHLISTEEVPAGGVQSIIEGPGIEITGDSQTGVYVVAHAQTQAEAGTYIFGGYAGETDINGHIRSLNRVITIEEAAYDMYFWRLTTNPYGSIVNMERIDRRPMDRFSKLFSGNRNDTSMAFTTGINGSMCVTYTGDLGVPPAVVPGSPTGLVTAAGGFAMLIDGVSVQSFLQTVGGRVTGMHSLTPAVYQAGDHTITIQAPTPSGASYNFLDNGILDVQLITSGA